jgi:integrase/recombinase XerD
MDKLEILLVKFSEHMKVTNFSDRTMPDYIRNVQRYLDYLRGLRIENIAEADRRVLLDYQAKVYLETFKGKPLTPATQKARLTCVKTFYRYLLKNGHILYDPAADLDMPKLPKLLPHHILSKKEMGVLLSKPDLETPLGMRDRAIMEVLYYTGIRASELVGLTLNDLDLAKGELRINQGKGRKDRLVPLGEMACDFLEIYLREARPKLAASGQPLLFVSKNGNRIRANNLYDMIRRRGEKAGLKTTTNPHGLRHTCATHLLKGKADIRQIQELLGHASIATTQRYTRVEITDLKRVLKQSHPRERREIETHDL